MKADNKLSKYGVMYKTIRNIDKTTRKDNLLVARHCLKLYKTDKLVKLSVQKAPLCISVSMTAVTPHPAQL